MQTEKDSKGYFHILSGDKGFDALIRYLKGRGVYAARRKSIAEIPALMNGGERLVVLTTQIKEKKPGLPGKRKALESYIQSTFGRALSAEELGATIQELIHASVIEISGTDAVSYRSEDPQ